MKQWLKYVLIYVVFLVLGYFLLIDVVPKYVVAPMLNPNTTSLASGQILVLDASGPVKVVAYSEDGETGSALVDVSTKDVVLHTEAGLRPGYFEGTAMLDKGEYRLTGDETVFLFSGNNFISADNPQDDSVLNRLIRWVFVAYAFFTAVSLAFDWWQQHRYSANRRNHVAANR